MSMCDDATIQQHEMLPFYDVPERICLQKWIWLSRNVSLEKDPFHAHNATNNLKPTRPHITQEGSLMGIWQKKPYSCGICRKAFQRQKDLTFHNQCNSLCRTPVELKRNMRKQNQHILYLYFSGHTVVDLIIIIVNNNNYNFN